MIIAGLGTLAVSSFVLAARTRGARVPVLETA
jgi:hypothetical protein